MKVRQLVVMVGALALELLQDDTGPDDRLGLGTMLTLRVRDPLAFATRLNGGAEEDGEGVGLYESEEYTPPPPKKKRASATPVSPVDDGRVHSPAGMGRGGPRLGMMSIKIEDLQRVKAALDAKDGSLSPLQRSALRLRLGLGTEPHTVREIAELLHLKFHSEVSDIVFSGLKVLGIRRQKVHRYKGRPSRAKTSIPVEKPSAFTPIMEEQ